MPFKKIDAKVLAQALMESNRQYLVGSLSNPQTVQNIEATDVEIGISSYDCATTESAHRHTRAREYQLILKGMTEYLDLETKEVHRFVRGDFYAIYPETSYAQRVKADTEILFVKAPGGNDKVAVHEDEDVQKWMKERLRVQRVDFGPGDKAPTPNSLKPAVAVAVRREDGRILLTQRRDSKNWTMPGGTMELNESVEECAVREVKEETGLEIEVLGLVGTYTNPNNIIAYSDGEVRREFSILLAAYPKTDNLIIDDESTEIGWFRVEELQALALANSQRTRLDDFVSFCAKGRTFCR